MWYLRSDRFMWYLVNPKGNQPWIFIERTDAEAEAPILWPPDMKSWLIGKAPDAFEEKLRAGGEGDDRGWDGWMASLTQWAWVWPNSKRQWRRGKPDILKSMGVTKSWTPWWLNNNNNNKWKDEASSRPYPIGSHNAIFVPDLAKIWLNALWSIYIIS